MKKLRNLVVSLVAASATVTCKPAAVDDPPSSVPPTGTPLKQDSAIPVEVLIGDQWLTVKPSQEAVERFAAAWCLADNVQHADSQVCGQSLTMPQGVDMLSQPAVTPTDFNACKVGLCVERAHTCAGYLLEEMARSPTGRRFDPGTLGLRDIRLVDQLALSEVELADLNRRFSTTNALAVRFQPLKPSAKAAAMRGAMNRYLDSTQWAKLMATVKDSAGTTCAQRFAQVDYQNQTNPPGLPTGLVANAEGRVPTWSDLLLQSYLDAAVQYSGAIEPTADAMRAAAQVQIDASDAAPDEAATAWNGKVNSAVAVARLLAVGDEKNSVVQELGLQRTLSLDACGATNDGSRIGPTGVPVCPPISGNEGARTALGFLRALQVAPTPKAADDLVKVYLFRLLQEQPSSTTVTPEEALQRMGITREDVAQASEYLCAEATVNGRFITTSPRPESELAGVPLAAGLQFNPQPPHPGVLAGNFFGSVGTTVTSNPDSYAYATTGAVRALDSVRRIGKLLQTTAFGAPPGGASLVDPNLYDATVTFNDGLKIELGGRRLEFGIGFREDANISQLQVKVHGVPSANAEEYWIVQTLEGLKCVVDTQIDEQPCNPADYIEKLNVGATFAADPVHADLEGVSLTKLLTSIPKPGNPSAPISASEALYVLKVINGQAFPYGGILPTPGSLVLPGDPGYTRRVISPAGGTYDDVLRNALTPNTDDCSQLLDTCAGLPSDLWPPLESEVNGDPNNGQAYERAYVKYLDKARAAALEADRLGEEMLLFGLSMDEKADAAQAALAEECGADAHLGGECVAGATGEGGEVPGAALGDRQMCMWTYDGALCGCPKKKPDGSGGCPAGLTRCPLILDGKPLTATETARQANNKICKDQMQSLVGSGTDLSKFEGVAVPYTLNLSANAGVTPSSCEQLSALRYYADPSIPPDQAPTTDQTVLSRRREDFIRNNIIDRFGQIEIGRIASRLVYREEFADNFTLLADGEAVFRTGRDGSTSNGTALAPCTQNADGLSTGSRFWSNRLNCFKSGDPNLQEPANQPGYPDFAVGCSHPSVGANGSVGTDGCSGGSRDLKTADSEPEALRERWAWGFGHLRRSAATLFALTGTLDNRMEVMRPTWSHAFDHTEVHINAPPQLPTHERIFISSGDRGACSAQSKPSEPAWMAHCAQGGSKDAESVSRCVVLSPRANGLQTEHAGRPVNFNGFLPDVVPGKLEKRQIRGFLDDDGRPLPGFGWSPSGTRLGSDPGSGGVDPQFIYCDPPVASQRGLDDAAVTELPLPYGNAEEDVSGWAGGSIARPARFREPDLKYQQVMDEIWATPPRDEQFCTNDYQGSLKYLVWRSFCKPLNRVNFAAEWSDLKADREFMTLGRIPGQKPEVDGLTVGKWTRGAIRFTGEEYTQMLFDLREGTPSRNPPVASFQYPLTARNIADAVELACYANSVRPDAGISCEDLDLDEALRIIEDQNPNLGKIGAVIECYGRAIHNVVGGLVFAPASEALVKNFQAGRPLPSTGLGGQYLAQLSNQYESLVRIRSGLNAVGNAYLEFATALRQISYIQVTTKAALEANTQRKYAAIASALAQAASSSAAAFSPAETTLNPMAIGLHIASAGASAFAGYSEVQALESDRDVINGQTNQQITDQRLRAIQTLAAAKTAVDDVLLAGNNLAVSTDALRLSQKRAARAKSRIDWSSTAGGDDNDPQYFNTASRRIYNTRLRRYETALGRAKKLAFIARRAIELRFGVDLQRQVGDLTLVEAPAKWANDICEMQGINYAEIRDPANTIGTGEEGKFDFTNDGENFATAYIGEYIAKLDDFVNTYPFDYPLKEGDDTAVLSLADDILKVTPECPADGRNLLYYATEFDQRSTEEPFTTETVGWGSGGCDRPVSEEDATPWTDCVIAEPVANPPGMGGGNDIPETGQVYRIKNAGCFQDDPICPPLYDGESYYPAVGYRGQDLRDLSVGWHIASIWVHDDFPRRNLGASWRITDSAGAVVAEAALGLTNAWERHSLPFYITSRGDYRLEIHPTDPNLPLTYLEPDFADEGGSGIRGEDWYGFLVTAAQVETVRADINDQLPPASAWIRTGVNRTTESVRCNELRGTEMRKRFERKCEFVCADGIKQNCSASDPNSIPTEVCFYETQFAINLEQVESGDLIPSGQVAIGNFNYRHNVGGINLVGTGVTDCSSSSATSCYYNGFAEYSLIHDGSTRIRAHDGSTLAAHMQTAYIEHGKALATERVITNPPSSTDSSLIEPYMKGELKGRPLQGLYSLRIWDDPGLRWEQVDDIQLYWRYHYWTRFRN